MFAVVLIATSLFQDLSAKPTVGLVLKKALGLGHALLPGVHKSVQIGISGHSDLGAQNSLGGHIGLPLPPHNNGFHHGPHLGLGNGNFLGHQIHEQVGSSSGSLHTGFPYHSGVNLGIDSGGGINGFLGPGTNSDRGWGGGGGGGGGRIGGGQGGGFGGGPNGGGGGGGGGFGNGYGSGFGMGGGSSGGGGGGGGGGNDGFGSGFGGGSLGGSGGGGSVGQRFDSKYGGGSVGGAGGFKINLGFDTPDGLFSG